MTSYSLDMSRPVFRCKWKEVLGFDEEYSSSTRHCRSQSTSTSTSTSSNQSSAYAWSPQLIFQSSLPTYPRLPRDITFFRSRHDILLSPSSPAPSSNDLKPLPAPPHLFYITVQRPSTSGSSPTSFTSSEKSIYSSISNYKQHVGRPDLILHSGPSRANTVISYAKFHPETGETEITLCPPAPKAVSANFSTLDLNLPSPSPDTLSHSRSNSSSTSSSTTSYSRTTSISTSSTGRKRRRTGFHIETLTPSHPTLFKAQKHTFYHTHPSSPKREKFEWRYTSGPFLRENDRGRESGGLKLIRCETGEVVAVYAGLGEGADRERRRNPRGVLGMMRFLNLGVDETGGLEGEWEVLAVMGILSVVERNKRELRAERRGVGDWLD